MKKKIIVIAYKFPPFPGVGAYRWSKLCKYLAKAGYQIHVITVNWKKTTMNTLDDDIHHKNIKIHRIGSMYPLGLFSRRDQNLLYKLIFKLFQICIGKILYFDDMAQLWGWRLVPYCQNLIKKEKISVVIATGHPFQSNRWAAIIKRRNNSIKLIQDFRDPWANDPDIKRNFFSRIMIQRWQRFSVEGADAVVAVTKGLLEFFIDSDSNIKEKGVVIRNGVDTEFSIKGIRRSKKIPKNIIKIIYAGSLGNKRDMVLCELLKVIEKKIDIYHTIKIDIFGGSSGYISSKFKSLISREVINFYPAVKQKELFKKMAEYNYALHLNNKGNYFAASTKIYEYAFLKIPTFSLNYGGELDYLVKKFDLGISVNLEIDNLELKIGELISDKRKYKFKGIEQFSYSYIAQQYSDLIQSMV